MTDADPNVDPDDLPENGGVAVREATDPSMGGKWVVFWAAIAVTLAVLVGLFGYAVVVA